MKWILGLLVTVNAFAVTPDQKKIAFEQQNACDNVIQFDETNLYLGFGKYLEGFDPVHKPIPGRVEVIDILHPENKVILNAEDGVVGIKSVQNTLYVLTYTALEEWDMQTWTRVAAYKTYLLDRPMQFHEHAKGLYFYNNQFVIAHGRLGISIFDLQSKSIVKQAKLEVNPNNLESQVVDVDGSGANAVLAVDDYTAVQPDQKPAYHGIVIFDMKTQKFTRKSAEKDFDPGVMGVNVIDGKIITAFHPALWLMDLAKLSVEKRLWNYPLKGHGTEKLFVDNENVYMCFREPGVAGKNTFHPQSFKRSDIGL